MDTRLTTISRNVVFDVRKLIDGQLEDKVKSVFVPTDAAFVAETCAPQVATLLLEVN